MRKVNAQSHIITTVAGYYLTSGGYNGDNILATHAKLNGPVGILVRNQNLYIADNENDRVRKVANINVVTSISTLATTNLSVYPNPTQDLLQVHGLTSPCRYHITGMSGAVLQQGTLQPGNAQLSFARYPTGLYILELNDGNEHTIHKIVKS